MNMGLFGKKEEEEIVEVQGKYEDACSVCGKSPCDKKWGGQYFHKKCFRKMRKGASKML
jgi:hypothetical protein